MKIVIFTESQRKWQWVPDISLRLFELVSCAQVYAIDLSWQNARSKLLTQKFKAKLIAHRLWFSLTSNTLVASHHLVVEYSGPFSGPLITMERVKCVQIFRRAADWVGVIKVELINFSHDWCPIVLHSLFAPELRLTFVIGGSRQTHIHTEKKS